jgi:integrase
MTPRFEFHSAIGPLIARYVDFKLALGRKFITAQYILAQFDRFLLAANTKDFDLATFNLWSAHIAHLLATTRAARMRIIYHLCVFRRRTDPACFIPDPSFFPSPQPRPWPYIFSEDEIVRLLSAAERLSVRHHPSPLYRQVARLTIVLLYTTGLRRGELVKLRLADYDAVERLLRIHDSKFHKSRLVPLSDDAAEELAKYLSERCQSGFPSGKDSPLLYHGFRGAVGYTGTGLWQLVQRLFRLADIRTSTGRTPRVHDLRFTFAVQAILRWYKAGVEVQARLPALAAYMGHSSPVSTQYYLRFVEPLAQTVCERFNRHCSRFLFESRDGGLQ